MNVKSIQRISQWAILAIILLSPLVFCPWSYDSFELPKLLIVRIFIVITLIAAALEQRKEPKFPKSPIHLPVLALFVVTLTSTFFSIAPYQSFVGTYQNYGGLLRSTDMVVLYFITVYIFPSLEIRRVFIVVTIAGTVMAIYGMAQHFGFEPGLWNISEEAGTSALKYRSFATLGSPSFLGLYLAMALPLGIACMASEVKRFSRAMWGMALALMSICLVFTYSRAAWLGASLSMVIWVLEILIKASNKTVRTTNVLPMIIIVSAVIFGVLIAPAGGNPSVIERAKSVVDPEGASAQVRFKLWDGSLDMIVQRPALGWGPDTFRFVFPRFATAGMTEVQRRNVSAHNDFLDRATQTGLLGVAVYLWLLVSIMRVLLKRAILLPEVNPNSKSNIVAIGTSLLAYFVTIQFGFSSIAPMALWWLLLGCLTGYQYEQPSTKSSYFLSPRLKMMSFFILIIIWIVLTGWTFSWFTADVHFQHGKVALMRGESSSAIDELGHAISWNTVSDFYLARLGQIQEELGLDGKDCFHSAINSNPINSANHALLATSFQRSGQDMASLDEWQATIVLDPQWAQAHNAIAIIYHRLGDDLSAISAYLKAIEIDPNYAVAYNNLGNAYLSKGNIDQAIECYKRALRLSPGWDTAQRNMQIALKLYYK